MLTVLRRRAAIVSTPESFHTQLPFDCATVSVIVVVGVCGGAAGETARKIELSFAFAAHIRTHT